MSGGDMIKTKMHFNRLALLLLLWLPMVASVYDDADDDVPCGTRPGHRPQDRIFNGRDSVMGAWPWIGQTSPGPALGKQPIVLIDREWGLIQNINIEQVKYIKSAVFADITRSGNGSSPYRQEVAIRRVYSHPQHLQFQQNDIAVVRFEEPVNITDYVRPICLNKLYNEWERYDNCWIAGWGFRNEYGDTSAILQEGFTRIRPSANCSKDLHGSELCGQEVGNGESSICAFEYGAPMMCTDDAQRWYLLGQSSYWRFACGNNTSVYSRISNLTGFVEDTINRVEVCSDPDYRCNDDVTCVLEHERGLCDRIEQCPDGDDEKDCPIEMCTNTTCSNGGICSDTEDGYSCECTDDWIGRNCEIVNCGETNIAIPIGAAVNLSSPLYPDNYPHNSVCQWTINVPDGYKVLVEFLDFSTEFGYDGITLDETAFTGSITPENFTSTNEVLSVEFSSDFSVTDRGFLLRLSAIDVSGLNECEWSPCENNGTCTDEEDGFECVCAADFTGRICNRAMRGRYCGEQDIVLASDSSSKLTSFNYNGINSSTVAYRCKWIVTAPEGRQVRVEFIDISTIPLWEVLFLDGIPFSGAQTPEEDFVSEGNVLEILWTTYDEPQVSIGFHVILSDYLAPDADECDSQPCQNGGVCFEKTNGFNCKCRRGFAGPTCQTVTGKGISCGPHQVRCRSGRCIKATYVCDGRNNCGDISDEIGCDCDFRCHNGRCLPERYVCDRNNNCGDWSDELRPEC